MVVFGVGPGTGESITTLATRSVLPFGALVYEELDAREAERMTARVKISPGTTNHILDESHVGADHRRL